MIRRTVSVVRLTQALTALGFNDNQAGIYAVLHSVGRCTARELASATGISRVTIQSILEKFEAEHLVCGVYEGKKRRYYSPADPRHLSYLLDDRISQLTRQRDELAAVFAEAAEAAEDLHGFGVYALRGAKGWEYLGKDMLACKEDVSVYADVSALSAQDYTNLSQLYIPKAVEAKIPTRCLLLDSPSARRLVSELLASNPDAGFVTMKITSASNVPIALAFACYADRVALVNTVNLTVALIRDAFISNVFRLHFANLWK